MIKASSLYYTCTTMSCIKYDRPKYVYWYNENSKIPSDIIHSVNLYAYHEHSAYKWFSTFNMSLKFNSRVSWTAWRQRFVTFLSLSLSVQFIILCAFRICYWQGCNKCKNQHVYATDMLARRGFRAKIRMTANFYHEPRGDWEISNQQENRSE